MADTPRSARVLADLVNASPEIKNAVTADPAALGRISDVLTEAWPPPAYVGDKMIYRIVVGALGIVAIAAMLGAIYLSTVKDATIPDVLTALGAAAIGALAGLLAPSPGKAS
jgi:hypothetical protein